MTRHISAQVRYRLAATAFAVLGGIWCLGALIGRHETTFLVVGMMHIAVSMLFMSLRPAQGATKEHETGPCDRCSSRGPSRGETMAESTPRRAKPAGITMELTTGAVTRRLGERKSKTWSI